MKRSIETTCLEDTARTYTDGLKIPWWAWFWGPRMLVMVIGMALMAAFVFWQDAQRSTQYRAYIAKYQCVETAIETPPGHTYFRYTCNNGYQFTLGRKP